MDQVTETSKIVAILRMVILAVCSFELLTSLVDI